MCYTRVSILLYYHVNKHFQKILTPAMEAHYNSKEERVPEANFYERKV